MSRSTIKFPKPSSYKLGWPWTRTTPRLEHKFVQSNPWPRISIVTPCFNHGKFIEETIRSVLLQDYPNLEYIVIDGGSTDNSVEVIAKYESWLSFWVSENDLGQSDALNKGFTMATGDICAYLNSDDVLLPGALSTASEFFLSNPKAQWAASSVLVGEGLADNKVVAALNVPFPYFVVDLTLPQQGVFWSSEVLPKPWFDITKHFRMDHKFFSEIYLKHGPPSLLDQVTAFFRIHPESKTSTLEDIRWSEHKELVSEICGEVDENTSTLIRKEERRIHSAKRTGEMLCQTPKSYMKRLRDAVESGQLLTTTPYALRDRTFISAFVRLSLRSVGFGGERPAN